MLSVQEALHKVLEHASGRAPAMTPLDDALGLVLAEDVPSDADSPPFDKSMVDGYAVRSADLTDGKAQLAVIEEVMAGAVPTRELAAGSCTRLMTGAPLPKNADAVVMHERTVLTPAGVQINDSAFRPGQNLMRRGTSVKSGDIVLRSGNRLGPAEIGLLAEIGRTSIEAIPLPTVAILSTGNELVPADRKPGLGQIRNSNGPMLAAAVRGAGAIPRELNIARDEPSELRRLISTGLEAAVLLLSGGVSAGDLDLVPEVLAELGVEQVFHKVRLKPGKPLWFGIAKRQAGAGPTLVFGVPGNPVSSLVCFILFVKPALHRLAGLPIDAMHSTQQARLTRPFNHRGDRPTYFPACVVDSPEGLLVEPRPWSGSGDLHGFVGANCLIAFAAGDRSYEAGEVVDFLSI